MGAQRIKIQINRLPNKCHSYQVYCEYGGIYMCELVELVDDPDRDNFILQLKRAGFELKLKL
jgi:hypothetical protein